ncbi:MAG: hypothetical protein ABSE69_08460 [Roseiarcus sp.]|jgi:hypothetical protein
MVATFVAGPSATSLRFEIQNSRPVDLLDLTGALSALGEAYQDYVTKSGFDVERGNVRLSIREIRTGSIIADLASIADQASFVLDHIDVIAGFAASFNDILQRLLLVPASGSPQIPTKREAAQAIAVMEPIAKDGGAQLFLNVAGDLHINHNYNSQQANAIQNSAHRLLGPSLPVNQIYQDQILALYQVRGDASSMVGDKGIIEGIAPNPAKLLFASEQVKNQVVGQPENPFQKLFIVDVEARATEGKVRLYRVLAVKSVIDRD